MAAPKKTTTVAKKASELKIPPLKMQQVVFHIEGDVPYVQHKFSQKKRAQMRAKHEQGSMQAGKRTAKPPRDFNQDFIDATHFIDQKGGCGIPAAAFRAAMVSACRLVGFKMTIAKMALFIVQDGFDVDDSTALVRIDGNPEASADQPHYTEHTTRNETGVADIRARPMWDPGWTAKVRVEFDADQFKEADVKALMERAGRQVGVGEGRPDSKKSVGMGWGTFRVVSTKAA